MYVSVTGVVAYFMLHVIRWSRERAAYMAALCSLSLNDRQPTERECITTT